MRHNTFLFLLLAMCLTGCMSAKGFVQNETNIDFHVPVRPGAQTCKVEVTRDFSKADEGKKFGDIIMEGSSVVNPLGMEQAVRNKACEHGASLALIEYESYGAPFVGSLARVSLFR